MASNVVQAVQQQKSGVEAYIKGARGWYAQLVPSHLSAEQFQALLLNELRTDRKLRDAAERNPLSFKAAANECARLGGTPGVDFFFVPFEYRKGARAGTVEITGLVGWQLEVQQMHMADPNVLAVEAEVVRRGGPKQDYFRRPGPGHPMVEHEIMDDGLATAAERGHLAAAYCYLRYRDGSVSTTTVILADEMREQHWDKAKTHDFWGEWPEGKHPVEIGTTPDMWRKSAVHKHFDRVPHSAEYLQNLIRTATIIAEAEHPTGAVIPADTRPALVPGRRMLTAHVLDDEPETPAAGDDTTAASRPPVAQGNGTDEPAPSGQVKGDERRQAPRAARPANSRGAQPPPPQDTKPPAPANTLPAGAGDPASRKDVVKITTLLDDMPLGTPADVAEALSWLAGRPITGPEDLTQAEADNVWGRLNDLLSRAGDGGPGMAASLLWEDVGKDQSEADHYKSSAEDRDG